MRATELQEYNSRSRRRWYQHSVWTLIVSEQTEGFQYQRGRILQALAYFSLAFILPAAVAWRADYLAMPWPILMAGLLFTFIGAGTGVLMAGWRGALASAITAVVLFAVAVGVLSLVTIVAAMH